MEENFIFLKRAASKFGGCGIPTGIAALTAIRAEMRPRAFAKLHDCYAPFTAHELEPDAVGVSPLTPRP